MKLYEYELKLEDIICSDKYLQSFPDIYIKTDHLLLNSVSIFFFKSTKSPSFGCLLLI